MIAMVTRTPAQQCASAENGKKSNGPTSEAGKSRSAMNHLRHGIRARRVVLANESVDDYLAEAERWVSSLCPVTDAETEVVLDIVDVRFRLGRVDNAENHMTRAAVAEVVGKTTEAKRLSVESNALLGLEAMKHTLGQATSSTCAELEGLVPAIRNVLAIVTEAEALGEQLVHGLVQLDADVVELGRQDGTCSAAPLVHRLLEHTGWVQDDLRHRQEVDMQSLKKIEFGQVERAVPRDDAESKRIEAYRRQLERRLQGCLDLFEQLRRLRPAAGPSGSFARPVLVNLRSKSSSPSLALG